MFYFYPLVQRYLLLRHRPFSAISYFSLLLNTLVVLITAGVACSTSASASYEPDRDDFGKIALPARAKSPTLLSFCFVFRWYWIVLYLLAALLALVVESFRTHRLLPLPISYLECWADMTLAVALLPQLVSFHRSKDTFLPKRVARFVIFFLCAEFFSLVYWYDPPKFIPFQD